MNAATHRELVNFTHAANALRQLDPVAVPPIPFAAIARDAGHRGEAIAAARAFLEAIGRDTAGHDAPFSWCAWHRIAWLSVLRAAAIDAGHGHEDAPRWHRMTTAELAAELDELTAQAAA